MLYKFWVASQPLDGETVFKKRKLCDSVPPNNICTAIITCFQTKHISILSGTSSVFMEAYMLLLQVSEVAVLSSYDYKVKAIKTSYITDLALD